LFVFTQLRLNLSKNKWAEIFFFTLSSDSNKHFYKEYETGYMEKYETIIVPPESKVKLRVNRNLMNCYVGYSVKCDTTALFMTCKL